MVNLYEKEREQITKRNSDVAFVAIWNRSKNRCAIVDMSPFTTLASVSIYLSAYKIRFQRLSLTNIEIQIKKSKFQEKH